MEREGGFNHASLDPGRLQSQLLPNERRMLLDMEGAVLIKQQIRVEVWEKAVRPTTSWVNPGGGHPAAVEGPAFL